MTNTNNPFSLQGKTVLVTGASSGIGKTTAIESSKLGANIIIIGRNKDRLNSTFKELEGKDHLQIIADLTLEDDVHMLTEKIPNINGLVNAAGTVKTLPFQFINRVELEKVLNINFMAPVLLTQKLVRTKKITKKSSIVFLSSIEGPIITHIGNSMYAASKGAVSAIVKSIAIELAAKNIRVNAVLPGITKTPLIHTDEITLEQLESELKRYPLKRYGNPDDIANAIIYLLSDASSWVTGTNLIIDGGFTLL